LSTGGQKWGAVYSKRESGHAPVNQGVTFVTQDKTVEVVFRRMKVDLSEHLRDVRRHPYLVLTESDDDIW